MRLAANALLMGSGLIGPVLHQARRAWPVARRALRTPAGVAGGVGLALLVTAPFVWRAITAAEPVQGTGLLQGSALSPLLTNLYMHDFDAEITEEGFHLVRYADDLVISSPSEAEARRARWACQDALRRLHLNLNEDKSGLVQWRSGFEFLGAHLGG